MSVVSQRKVTSLWVTRSDRSPVSFHTSAGADFSTERISSGLVRVAVAGELDMRNAPALRSYAGDQMHPSSRLVLDLSDVEFFGSAGLIVFDELDTLARRRSSRWALVGGRPVHRLLRVLGDPVHAHASLESAIHALRVPA
ncbi:MULTISPECIES: STAS domain-containing protein [Rhodococcus]|uniref:STAS domain-containing protein n=1 Tax=Rhodococcus TaxID=1827 RepID=UPI00067830EE|nr:MULTISPECIES: STAS domain-containing protein [Rhodococcus]MBC2588810.1 STAS domain-containing protein [Rhodococcus aetherivorans]QIX51657.1 STAS domain-containing protein [Rhodococcus sp. DMU1]QRI78184.1 STAS domain-containing protein [Rhodococcus aetherivorans]QSE61598.1 STAS domain-containing protein [Rhodococcus sp. PSBB066]